MKDYRLTNLKDVTCRTNELLVGFSCVLTTFGDVLGYVDINQQNGSWIITDSKLFVVVPDYTIVDFDLTSRIISCVGVKANESEQ